MQTLSEEHRLEPLRLLIDTLQWLRETGTELTDEQVSDLNELPLAASEPAGTA